MLNLRSKFQAHEMIQITLRVQKLCNSATQLPIFLFREIRTPYKAKPTS